MSTPWLIVIPFLILITYAGWHEPRNLFYLLIIFLPWSIEFNFSGTLSTDLPDEPIMLLLSGITVAYIIYNPSLLGTRWRHPLILLLTLHLVWILFSSFQSTNQLISFKFFLAKTWYVIAFVLAPLIFLQKREHIIQLAKIFLYSLLAVTLLILLRHAQTGFLFATVNDAIYPLFRNHVNYSAMLICSLPLLIAIFHLNNSKKIRAYTIIAFIIIISAIILSYSRGAWLAAIAGLITFWFIRKKIITTIFVMALLITFGSYLYFKNDDRYLNYAHNYSTTAFHPDFTEHLIATYQFRDMSATERLNRWIAATEMIKDRPLTGFGPANFYNEYKQYTVPAFRTWVSSNPERSTVHNYFLLVLVEQGWPGLLIFLMLVFFMLYYSQRIYHNTSDPFIKTSAAAIASVIVMILSVNFLSDLIETDKVGSIFFLCLAMLVWLDANFKTDKAEHRASNPS